jgi:hypothetical protein
MREFDRIHKSNVSEKISNMTFSRLNLPSVVFYTAFPCAVSSDSVVPSTTHITCHLQAELQQNIRSKPIGA